MSAIFLNDFFENGCPYNIPDQYFAAGLVLEDLLSVIAQEVQNLVQGPTEGSRPCRAAASQKDSGSTVNCDKDKYQASLDVQQFKPEEITVKVNDNTITVEGNHEEKEDEHGFISRHFVRKYVLPKEHDINRVESKLSSDGIVTITAPKMKTNKEEQTTIPVVYMDQPSKPVEEKGETKEAEQ